jgi:predicted phosphoribosyltransferase
VEGVAKVREFYDQVVCPHTPQPYVAVGQWYVDFHQVEDDEVRTLLGADG